MTPDTWEKLASMLAALSNLLGAAIFLLGAVLSSRFRLAFALMAGAASLFTISNLFWLAMSLERTCGISLLSREDFIQLFPVQALCAYIAVPLGLIGSGVLVWQVKRLTNRSNQPLPGE
jgi:hypothetical protein